MIFGMIGWRKGLMTRGKNFYGQCFETFLKILLRPHGSETKAESFERQAKLGRGARVSEWTWEHSN